jgi:hypothetical protein
MEASTSSSSIRRCAAVVLAVVAACVLLLPITGATAQRRTIPVMIQTVPALPGAKFSLEGKTFNADENGLALTVVPEPGTYSLRLLSTKLTRDDVQSRFSLWSDEEKSASRSVNVQSFTYLQAGFEKSRVVSLDLVGKTGETLDPSLVDAILLTGPGGDRIRLTGAGPYRLLTTAPVSSGKNLELRDVTYRVDEVIVDGRNVLGEDVSLTPSQTGELRLRIAVPDEAVAGPPAAQDRGTRDSAPALPPGLLIALASVGAGAVLLIVARRLHLGAAIKAGAVRGWSSTVAGARSLNPRPALTAAGRRLNPVPALSAAGRRLNPRPAMAVAVNSIRRLNPKPKLASGIQSLKAKTARKPKPAAPAKPRKSATRAPRIKSQRIPKVRPARTQKVKPPRTKKVKPPRTKKVKPPRTQRVKRPRKAKATAPRKPSHEKRGPSGIARLLTWVHGLDLGKKLTAGFRRRRLKAQLRELQGSGQDTRSTEEKARRGSLAEMKKKRGVPLLWLRGSRSRGSMRDYGQGPKVRIKLRNGHLVVGTIRRTPSHVDQDALNIFVERVYDEFGNETLNSPEDSFILPSQIVRIERATEDEEHRIIRLPDAEDRVIRLPDAEDRVIRLPEPDDQVTSRTSRQEPDANEKKADGGP